jgi:hypothetical protein
VKKVKFLGVAALTIALGMLAGCGEKKIDGSSYESFGESVQAMIKSLPADQQAEFSSTVKEALALGIAEEGKSFAQSVDGKNAEELLAYAKAGIEKKNFGGNKSIQFRP